MQKETLSISISASTGTVSAEYIVPDESICLMVLAHGAGAGMNHSFMTALAHSLAAAGIATLRFNFPFMENKKKRADVPAVAHQTVDAAIQHALASFPTLPLFVAGKSFGGRMSSQYLALYKPTFVHGIIFYGFPLHPDKKPSTQRADHLAGVSIPMLFLQGTRDTLARMDLVEEVCQKLPKATLVKIEGADHAFKAGKKDIISVLVNETLDWIRKVSSGKE